MNQTSQEVDSVCNRKDENIAKRENGASNEAPSKSGKSFDKRSTLSRSEAREVYNSFVINNHKLSGRDSRRCKINSHGNNKAIRELIHMGHFGDASKVIDYGCGRGQLAELVFRDVSSDQNDHLHWHGLDQSSKMIEMYTERCIYNSNNYMDCSITTPNRKCSVELVLDGNPLSVIDSITENSVDIFVSTYTLNCLSEEDIYNVLALAEHSLNKSSGVLLLANMAYGYRSNIGTFIRTAIWEHKYRKNSKNVGGCRPINIKPYLLEKGWTITRHKRLTPKGYYPHMVTEIVSAKPPAAPQQQPQQRLGGQPMATSTVATTMREQSAKISKACDERQETTTSSMKTEARLEEQKRRLSGLVSTNSNDESSPIVTSDIENDNTVHTRKENQPVEKSLEAPTPLSAPSRSTTSTSEKCLLQTATTVQESNVEDTLN